MAQSGRKRTAVVLGREDRGLRASCIAVCDDCITIPMRPGVDSLNVGMAATILLYELTR